MRSCSLYFRVDRVQTRQRRENSLLLAKLHRVVIYYLLHDTFSSLSFVGGLGLVHAVLQDTTHVGKRLGSGYAFVFSQLSQHQGLLVY